jgi:hypothetical protein
VNAVEVLESAIWIGHQRCFPAADVDVGTCTRTGRVYQGRADAHGRNISGMYHRVAQPARSDGQAQRASRSSSISRRPAAASNVTPSGPRAVLSESADGAVDEPRLPLS